MAVSITKDLSVTPKKGSLPLAITLHQSLSTNLQSEKAQVTYQLADPSGGVGFGTAGNKTLTRTRNVTANSPPFADKTNLVGSGEDLAILVIMQTLTDESGSQLTSSCSVRIGSYQ